MADVFKPDGTLNFACGLCGITDDMHTMECPIPDNQKAAGLVPDKRVPCNWCGIAGTCASCESRRRMGTEPTTGGDDDA